MIEVVAAVIELEGKVLAFQRGPAKYEYVSNKNNLVYFRELSTYPIIRYTYAMTS